MIGVSVRRWALSCAVRPVPPRLASPRLARSQLALDLVGATRKGTERRCG